MKSPIQDRAETLAHAKAANALERQLSSRKSIQELNEAHIMKTAVQDKAGQIEDQKRRSSLNSMLERRPTAKDLSQKNILIEGSA